MWVAYLDAPYSRRYSILGSPDIFIMLVDYLWIEQSKAFVLLGRFGTADNQQVSLSPAMRHSWRNLQPNVIKFTNIESWRVYQYHYQTQLTRLKATMLETKNPMESVFRNHRWAKLPWVRVPSLYGSSVQNLFHVVLLAPKILKWFPYFWKIYALLDCTV